jgi:hypothetical protein
MAIVLNATPTASRRAMGVLKGGAARKNELAYMKRAYGKRAYMIATAMRARMRAPAVRGFSSVLRRS